MKITVEMLKKAVEAEDDFGHEMRVRRVLLSVPGAKVEHGGSYTDPVEAKPRQFDLRFEYTDEGGPRRLQMAVECKNLSPDAPLIISGTNRTPEEAFHCYICSLLEAGAPNQPARPPSVFWAKKENQFYQGVSFVGKSLLRLKTNEKKTALIRASGPDEIYKGWSQALASADELCDRALQARKPGHRGVNSLTLPVVVVPDGTLWSMDYDWNAVNTSGPVAADEVQYFVNHKVALKISAFRATIRLSHIHFFTLKGLKLFLGSIMQPGGSWKEWFPENAWQVEMNRIV
jgi:hypothetical protein